MTLFKTSILSAIATCISICARFVVNKIISIYVGPAGLALIGQLQNFVALCLTFANGSINTGVTKYLAEKSDDEAGKDQTIIGNALWLNIFCAVATGMIVLFGAEHWADTLLSNTDYAHIFKVFSASLLFFSLNTLFMAVLNGKKRIADYITINIVGSLIGLLMSTMLIMAYGILGGLYALVLNQSAIFFVTFGVVIRRKLWPFMIGGMRHLPQKETLKKLLSYAVMTFTAAAISPLVNILIRTQMINHVGAVETGYWQGIWYISTMYLTLITTSLKTYYLPRLSELDTKQHVREEILRGYKILMPLVVASAVLIYLFRDLIILVAFTRDFQAMRELFLWQFVGDVLKIAGWLLGMVLAAKAMIMRSIIANTVFGFVFLILALLFIDLYGAVGATYAYALNYALFLPFIYWLAKPAFSEAKSKRGQSYGLDKPE
ncbi:MAG: O-antigen translocase [Alphaproteobacteria bacterium]